jgi:hypothetical protein
MPVLQRQTAQPDYRRFNLRGDHYACGYAMGQATDFRALGEPANIGFAEACAAEVRRQHAPLLDEYRGYADAQGRTWGDVLTHFSLNYRPVAEAGGCSTLIWRAEDGHMLAARNYDFTMDQRARHLIRSAPAGVQPILGANASLIGGRYDGVNGAGLCVALHLVRTDAPRHVAPGVPFHLIPRILLETCVTARQALERLLGMPVLHSFNYALADAHESFAVEAYAGALRVRGGGDHLITTNHFQHPDMECYHGQRQALNSRRRAARLEELWRERAGDPFIWAQRALADHAGPLCNHDRHLATLWSLVADLTARRVAYCMGAPCEQPFVEVDWPGTGDGA